MAKNAVTDWSTTAADNTDVGGVGIQGTDPASNMDNGVREMMEQIAVGLSDGSFMSLVYEAISGNDTVATTDKGQLFDCTATLELELPTVASAGAGFFFVVKANGGTVTLDPNGTENINGSSTSATVADGSSAIVVCNGSAWFTLTMMAPTAKLIALLAAYTAASASGATSLAFAEDTDNGSHAITLKAPASVAANADVTLPGTAGTLALTTAASESAAGLVELATVAEAQTGTDTERAVTPAGLAAKFVAATAQATTSGTAFDFTSIPSWVKRITVQFNAVSLSGSDDILVQIGDSGGIENTDYVASSITSTDSGSGAGTTSTAGYIIYANSAARAFNGRMTLTKLGSTNTWISDHVTAAAAGDRAMFGSGSKTLSATLDRVRLTRTGTDTFDAGSVNIMYE